VLDNNRYILVGGTSQSAPTFAAIAALLAQAFKSKTGKSFGFLNPLLYQVWGQDKSAFIDITQGDNICGERGCFATCRGFNASAGWDAVTGLGSPNYKQLLTHVNAIADKYVARQQRKPSSAYSSVI